jgi:hypothetical protein
MKWVLYLTYTTVHFLYIYYIFLKLNFPLPLTFLNSDGQQFHVHQWTATFYLKPFNTI